MAVDMVEAVVVVAMVSLSSAAVNHRRCNVLTKNPGGGGYGDRSGGGGGGYGGGQGGYGGGGGGYGGNQGGMFSSSSTFQVIGHLLTFVSGYGGNQGGYGGSGGGGGEGGGRW